MCAVFAVCLCMCAFNLTNRLSGSHLYLHNTDITWYLGAERKRCAPTAYAITFLDKNAKIERKKDNSYLIGRVICCNNEDEYYKWIAGLIMTEHEQLYPPRQNLVDLLS